MASTPELEARLQRFVHRAGELYTLPRVAVEVLELTSQPVVDARKLKQCIENDPALTAKLLRVVNSSLFGLSREVADLNQALALLGTKPLKLLVLGFSLPSALFCELAGDFLSRYWHHTLVKAVAARELAPLTPSISGDELFITGLLQDLGILILIQDIGRPYVRFVERMHSAGAELTAAERMALGFDHTEITSRLLAHWRLPAAVVEAARADNSASLGRSSAPTHRDVLHLGELLARLLVDRQPGVLLTLMQAAERFPSLGEQRLSRLIATLQEKVRQLAEVLSLDLPDELGYGDIMAQAHLQLASVAQEAAADLCQRSPESLAALEESRSLAERLKAMDQPSQPRSAKIAATREPPRRLPPLRTAAARAADTRSPSHAASAAVAVADDDCSLLGVLTAAIVECRQSRSPVSLLLIEIDHYDLLVSALGVPRMADVLRRLEAACHDLDHPRHRCLSVGEARLAAVLFDCDRAEAVRLGNRLLATCRNFASSGGHDLRSAVTFSIGAAALALPPRNFHTPDLLQSADRCLSGAHSSGGNCLKSIEL